MNPEPLPLFDVPPFPGTPDTVQLAARRTDPDTSVAAAHSITPGRTERAILDLFTTTRVNGLTDDELAAALAPEHYGPTVKSARSRLTRDGYLERCGEGTSTRGNRAGIYRAARAA